MRLNDVVKEQETIAFSEEVKEFFGQNGVGTYIPKCIGGNHNKTVITYQSMRGKSATPIPERFEEDEKLTEEIPAVPFNNKNADDKKVSKKAIAKIVNFMGFESFNNVKKHYMVNGATIPLQIGIGSKTNPYKQVLYVKQPDMSRLLGYELYNIISGETPLKYCFNEQVFVEEGIRGIPASATEQILINIQEYKEQFAKAAARAELMGVQEDTFKDSNRLIGTHFNTILFDFNIILEEPQGKRHNFLLAQYAGNIKHFMDASVARAYQDEKKQIAKRLERKISHIATLSTILGNQKFLDYTEDVFNPAQISLNAKIEKYYGQPNLLEYIYKRIYEFS